MRAPGRKTYRHLAEGRMPTLYEIVSSQLLYYPRLGFAVTTPATAWYAEHQVGSALTASDWEAFADPAATTYRSYVARQREQAAVDEALFRRASTSRVDPGWPRRVAPLRHVYHGLGMMAAYIGSMAPSGRIVIAAAFQAANETRRVHALARHLAHVDPRAAEAGREDWLEAQPWQPLRRGLEQALVVWDWGEAFAALDLALKPALDELVHVHLAAAARDVGDDLLANVLGSLAEDVAWERAWSRALLRVAIDADARNREHLEGWLDVWRPRAQEAVDALAAYWGVGDTSSITAQHDEFLHSCGLEGAVDAT